MAFQQCIVQSLLNCRKHFSFVLEKLKRLCSKHKPLKAIMTIMRALWISQMFWIAMNFIIHRRSGQHMRAYFAVRSCAYALRTLCVRWKADSCIDRRLRLGGQATSQDTCAIFALWLFHGITRHGEEKRSQCRTNNVGKFVYQKLPKIFHTTVYF